MKKPKTKSKQDLLLIPGRGKSAYIEHWLNWTAAYNEQRVQNQSRTEPVLVELAYTRKSG